MTAILVLACGACTSTSPASPDARVLDGGIADADLADTTAWPHDGRGRDDTTPGSCQIQCSECVCAAICNSKTYGIYCRGKPECACYVDGTFTKNVPIVCGSVQAMVTAYRTGCGFPGKDPAQLDGSVLLRDGPIVDPGREKDLGRRFDL
ncbi:MAG: hypothetical protein IT371_16905 [Deltaproteobacteria bacterium]|nr:hypothetical protein [Deltaproteobacteria bacterium]